MGGRGGAGERAEAGGVSAAPGRFDDVGAREATRAAVAEVEASTGAEIVVVLRSAADGYLHADLALGTLAAFGTLAALLYLPVDFPLWSFLLDPAVAFGLAVLAGRAAPPLRRLPAGRRRQAEAVRRAARAAFVELGIHRTRERTGILVFVSRFERRVEVVADTGIVRCGAGVAEWRTAVSGFEGVFRAPRPFPAFLAALRAMAGPLARIAPRRADDSNELPDERVSRA